MLSFDFDWLESEGVRGPELAATWARLSIGAGDSMVTRILDQRARTVRDWVFVPLYPLAEWLVANWWFLMHEVPCPGREAGGCEEGDAGFRRRHALAACREGYALPSLEIVTEGSRMQLRWTADRLCRAGIEFLNDGCIRMERSAFRESCADLVDRVIRRLDALDIRDTFLEQEWSAIEAADDEESKFCAAAAGLGWDPYAIDAADSAALLALDARLSDAVMVEAIPALDPRALTEGGQAIVDALECARSNAVPLGRVRSIGRRIRASSQWQSEPGHAGYELARRLRRELGMGGEPLPTTDALADALGESVEKIDCVPTQESLRDIPAVDGAVARDADGNPAFAFRPGREENRRFLFCRALAPVLAGLDADTLLTRAHSERQRQGRAFAAEFLAPAASLRDRVAHCVVASEDVDDLAVEFGISPMVVQHQLANHKIARIAG